MDVNAENCDRTGNEDKEKSIRHQAEAETKFENGIENAILRELWPCVINIPTVRDVV